MSESLIRWSETQPRRMLFIDTETTGLSSDDRIVTLGMVGLEMNPGTGATQSFKICHLVFDPGRRSHAKAKVLHGYDDWTLRHQKIFKHKLAEILELLEWADAYIAHNAAFDRRFLNKELLICGKSLPSKTIICTQELLRGDGDRFGPSLDEALSYASLSRSNTYAHSALEDAWLTMNLFMWATGLNAEFRWVDEDAEPENLIPPPPRPHGPLPRRRSR